MKSVLEVDRRYWLPDELAVVEAIERAERKEERRKKARFLKFARCALVVEVAVILFEGCYRLGSVVRGYPSIGGEALALLALAATGYYRFYKAINGKTR